jgi:hypothetical protein
MPYTMETPNSILLSRLHRRISRKFFDKRNRDNFPYCSIAVYSIQLPDLDEHRNPCHGVILFRISIYSEDQHRLAGSELGKNTIREVLQCWQSWCFQFCVVLQLGCVVFSWWKCFVGLVSGLKFDSQNLDMLLVRVLILNQTNRRGWYWIGQ